ncbi:MAG TPA: hypothetical protein VMH87_04695 [Pseudomonadales bacterium]|nr:hypothetical protein [Pseudomonadales bacterium]
MAWLLKLPPKKETFCSGGKWIFASPADALAVLIASKAIIIPTAPTGFFIPIEMDKNALSPARFPAIFIETSAFLYAVYVNQRQVFITIRPIRQRMLQVKLVFFRFGNYI